MSAPLDSQLDTCGCCDPDIPEAEHRNPPGQSELDYRIGTHSEFLRRMITRLPRWKLPDGDNAGSRPLGALTTRDSDDPAIATLDAWATVADVLSFYQERIANEGFLRTATERRSILQLAREIGYELNPGVSASTYLAFTVDDAPGAPGEATIRAGTQVQSVPAGEGELPQTFEAGEEFVAFVEWNKILPQRTAPQVVDLFTVTDLYLENTGLQLDAGDLLLLVEDAGDSTAAAVARTIKNVDEDLDNRRTHVRFVSETLLTLDDLPATVVSKVAVEHKETDSVIVARSMAAQQAVSTAMKQLPLTADNVQALILDTTLTEAELQALLSTHGWDADDLLTFVNETYKPTGADIQVFALRQSAGFFGHNAPRWETLPVPDETRGQQDTSNPSDPYDKSWDATPRSIWEDSQGTAYTEADAYLERAIDGIAPDGWVVFEVPTTDKDGNRGIFRYTYQVAQASETSLVDYALSGKATALTLLEATGDESIETPSVFKVRKTTAHVESDKLELSEIPITTEIKAGEKQIVLDLLVLGLEEEQPVVLSGEQYDAEGVTRTEVLRIERTTHSAGRTTLEFEAALQYSYIRETVTINANVVPADHGETVSGEVLGSGNGAATNQRFTLNKAPLTHVSSSSASGAESALNVRVNGIRWDEEDSLYGLGPTDKSYIVHIDDDGEATVIFGDGKRGARLPTGQENVTATYRSGIGSEGEVDAGALTLLKTRPFGVRSVINPEAATGAADPETLDDARDNAPLTVLTLDRIVSLQDFEDFARAFAGIGKAVAVSIWSGESQLVHITVADSNGDEVKSGTTLHTNLVDAIADARDPLREVRVESFTPRAFELLAKVLVDDAYEWDAVRAELEDALLEAFSFEVRTFGQPVSAAEVLSVMHDVDGVIAIDLEKLYLVDAAGMQQGPDYSPLLASSPAHYDTVTDAIVPAELLLINPSGVSLTQMQT